MPEHICHCAVTLQLLPSENILLRMPPTQANMLNSLNDNKLDLGTKKKQKKIKQTSDSNKQQHNDYGLPQQQQQHLGLQQLQQQQMLLPATLQWNP